MDIFLNKNYDIINLIFTYLDFKDIINLVLSSNKFKYLIKNDLINIKYDFYIFIYKVEKYFYKLCLHGSCRLKYFYSKNKFKYNTIFNEIKNIKTLNYSHVKYDQHYFLKTFQNNHNIKIANLENTNITNKLIKILVDNNKNIEELYLKDSFTNQKCFKYLLNTTIKKLSINFNETKASIILKKHLNYIKVPYKIKKILINELKQINPNIEIEYY